MHPTFIMVDINGSRFSPATPSTLVASSPMAKTANITGANTNFNNNDNSPNTWLTISLTFLATLLLILSTLVFAFSVITLTHLSDRGGLNDVHLTALYLNIFVFFVLMIVSLVGTFYFFPRAETPPKASRISSLTSYYAAALVLSVGVSTFCLYLLFQNQKCGSSHSPAQAGDAFVAYLCTLSLPLKALMALFLVLLWVVGIAIVVLSNAYAQHIRRYEQEEYDSDSSDEAY